MSCLGYDENPLKELHLEALRERRRQDAVQKVARFLRSATSGVVFVEYSASVDINPKKLLVSRSDRGLHIGHRGMRITAECFDPIGVEAAFRRWAATHMAHARVLPKTPHAHQSNGGGNETCIGS